MNKFRILVVWDEPQRDYFEIEAESEEEAQEKFENGECAEFFNDLDDYEIEKITDLGPVPPKPEERDPNQIEMEIPCEQK